MELEPGSSINNPDPLSMTPPTHHSFQYLKQLRVNSESDPHLVPYTFNLEPHLTTFTISPYAVGRKQLNNILTKKVQFEIR